MGERDQRLNKTAQLENAARLLEENWESNYEELNANNPAAIIALRSYQDAFLEQSISIADEIQRQFEGRVKRRNRGVKQQPLAVLRGSTMPAVLVELGFLTNPGEEDFLQSTPGKELLASAIYRAVKEYKFKREQRDAGIQTGGSSLTPAIEVPITTQSNSTSEESAEERTDVATPASAIQVELDAGMNLHFAVQIAVSRNDLPCLPENFKGLEAVWKQDEYGLFKYYCGRLATLTEAEALKEKVLEHYPDAYLVAFEKDKKIDLNEAKKRAP